MKLSNIIASVARKLGVTTVYHVAYQAALPNGQTLAGDGIYTIRPWLTQGNLGELRLAIDKGEATLLPNIISITRIGK